MILIKNTQRKFKVDAKAIKKLVQKLLDSLGYSDFDIGIWFTTDKTIAKLNKEYRGKKGPTDILSFPYHTELNAGQKIKVHSPDDQNLGDIIISLEYVHTSDQWKETPDELRLSILLVHGICHLIGYDHESEKDYKTMHTHEQALLSLLKQKS